jgi:hypothetical protein
MRSESRRRRRLRRHASRQAQRTSQCRCTRKWSLEVYTFAILHRVGEFNKALWSSPRPPGVQQGPLEALCPPTGTGVEKVLKQRANNTRKLTELLERANWVRMRRVGALDDPEQEFEMPGQWVWIFSGCEKEAQKKWRSGSEGCSAAGTGASTIRTVQQRACHSEEGVRMVVNGAGQNCIRKGMCWVASVTLGH